MESLAFDGTDLPGWAKFLGFSFLLDDSKSVHSVYCLPQTCQNRIVGERQMLLMSSLVSARNSSEMISSASALIDRAMNLRAHCPRCSSSTTDSHCVFLFLSRNPLVSPCEHKGRIIGKHHCASRYCV